MPVLEQPARVPLTPAPAGVLLDDVAFDRLLDTGPHPLLPVLEEARALVARGWVQGAAYREPHYCLAGALWKVTRGRTGLLPSLYDAAIVLLRSLIQERGGPNPHLSILVWNDHPGRTHAEVLALLDCAISTLEEGRTR